VLRHQEGDLYEEYLGCPWSTLVISWPIQTRSVYLAAQGQEDSFVIFVVALLPGLRADGTRITHLARWSMSRVCAGQATSYHRGGADARTVQYGVSLRKVSWAAK